MSKVYFAGLSSSTKEDNLISRIKKLFEITGEGISYKGNELIALKVHFGEKGIDTYLRPVQVAPIAEAVKEAGGKPFLSDTNTLYRGSRANAVDHHRTAQDNGWLRPVVDAPVVIADGLRGHEFYIVNINGEHYSEVKIGAAFLQADGIIGVSHFKGHGLTGFGGTLKNLGMGCGSRAGKLIMHCDVNPVVKKEKCIACGKCAEWCPADAISVAQYAEIDLEKCIGCGECKIVCPENAIKVEDTSETEKVQEKIAEYALGAIKGKENKSLYYNFITDVTPECDCPPWRKAPIVPDIGIVASRDPVAVDQAAYDLVNQTKGSEFQTEVDKFEKLHNINPAIQLKHAEKIGLGKRDYKLIDIS